MATENNNERKFEIEVTPSPFITLYQVMNTDTEQIAIRIHEIFKKIFNDLAFVYIEPKFNGIGRPWDFSVKFTFEKNAVPATDGKIDNLINLTTVDNSNRNDLYAIKQSQYFKSKSIIYELSDETKMYLAEFMPDYLIDKFKNPKSKNWKNVIRQTITPTTFGPFKKSDRIFLEVSGISLEKLLEKIYGNTMLISSMSSDNTKVNTKAVKCVYRVDMLDGGRPIKPLGGNMGVFNVFINRYDEELVEKKYVGKCPTSIPIVPGFSSNK